MNNTLQYAPGALAPAAGAATPLPTIGALLTMLVNVHGYVTENNAYLAESLKRANGPFGVSGAAEERKPAPEGLIDAIATELDRLLATLIEQRQMLDVLAARCT